MSRFPEGDMDSEWAELHQGRYEHNVKQALKGKRGQKILREMEEALLAMPEPKLIKNRFTTAKGECCAIGALVAHRFAPLWGVSFAEAAARLALEEDEDGFDEYEEADETMNQGLKAGLTQTLVWEIAYRNDDYGWNQTDEQRWEYMLGWVRRHLRPLIQEGEVR